MGLEYYGVDKKMNSETLIEMTVVVIFVAVGVLIANLYFITNPYSELALIIIVLLAFVLGLLATIFNFKERKQNRINLGGEEHETNKKIIEPTQGPRFNFRGGEKMKTGTKENAEQAANYEEMIRKVAAQLLSDASTVAVLNEKTLANVMDAVSDVVNYSIETPTQ